VGSALQADLKTEEYDGGEEAAMAYSRICVAAALQRYLDLTPIAERLRDLAGVLARAYDIPVAVVSVEAPVELLPDVETTAEKLERLAAPLSEQGLVVSTRVLEGRPSDQIAAYVRIIDADLVIVGSHSKRGVLDVGLGSTAAALLREVEGTVLMVRPTAEEQDRAQELIIPRYPVVFPYG
jgi:nucleotide-binding universal stress UspA family protein